VQCPTKTSKAMRDMESHQKPRGITGHIKPAIIMYLDKNVVYISYFWNESSGRMCILGLPDVPDLEYVG